jgi:hypothetical protein
MAGLKISIICIFFLASVLAREIEIEDFQPVARMPSSGDYLDYGTLRVTKIKRNEFSVSGDFEVKQSCGDEKMVSKKNCGRHHDVVN